MGMVRRWGLLSPLLLAGCNLVMPDVDTLLCREPRAPIAPAIVAANPDVREIIQVQATQPMGVDKGKPKTLLERLEVPKNLPGANAPAIKLPPSGAPKEEVEGAFKKYFPPLPALPALPHAQPRPLSLHELEDLARTHSPVLRQAAHDIDGARGVALQLGLYPNPKIGYEGDDYGVDRTAGKHGAFFEQTFKTAGKLRLARAAALMDVRGAEAKYRQAEAEVLTQVRGGYFAVLSARKNFEVNRALSQFTDEVYKVLVTQLRVGEVAAYETMQVRVLALQARTQVIQSHNRYVSAWKQLAAALGTPELALTELEGQIDRAIPRYDWDQTLAQVLSQHSDVLVAAAGVDKAAVQLELARVQPVPDIDLRTMVQHDSASQPRRVTAGVSVGIQLPLFDRNQGNLMQAAAAYRRAQEEHLRVRAHLTGRLAEAFERYENNREILELYTKQILPNQVQAFRAIVARHYGVGAKEGASYTDLVTAEQTLVNLIGNYLTVLRDQWTAAVDIAGLLQTSDMFQMERIEEVLPIPELHKQGAARK